MPIFMTCPWTICAQSAGRSANLRIFPTPDLGLGRRFALFQPLRDSLIYEFHFLGLQETPVLTHDLAYRCSESLQRQRPSVVAHISRGSELSVGAIYRYGVKWELWHIPKFPLEPVQKALIAQKRVADIIFAGKQPSFPVYLLPVSAGRISLNYPIQISRIHHKDSGFMDEQNH